MAAKSSNEKIKSILEAKIFPKVCAVISDSRVRRERALAALLDALQKKKDVSKDSIKKVNCRDLNKKDFVRLLSDSASLSLFSSTKVFILQDADELNAAGAKEMSAIIEESGPEVLFLIGASSLNKTSALYKAADSRDGLIQLGELKGYELSRWVEKELKASGLSARDNKVIESLVEIGGSAPDGVAPLVERLALYCENGLVSGDDIEAMFRFDPDAGEFELIDAITQGNVGRAELLIEEVIKSGKSPFGLSALLFRAFSQLLIIKSMKERGMPSSEIKARLGLSPWLAQKHFASAERFSLKKLQSALQSIVRTDSLLKNKSLGANAILSQLAHDIA